MLNCFKYIILKINDFYFFLLCLLSFTIPFIGFGVPKYILGLLIVFNIARIFIHFQEFKQLVYSSKKQFIAVLIFPIYLGTTLIYSEDFSSGLALFGRFSFCFLIPFVLLTKKKRGLNYDWVIISFLFGTFLLILVTLIVVLLNWDATYFYSYGRFYYQNLSDNANLHPGYFSLIVSLSIFISLYYVKGPARYVFSLLLMIFLILLSSKGIIMITICCLIVYLLKTLNKDYSAKNWIVLLLVGTIVLVVFSKTLVYKRVLGTFESFKEVSTVYDDRNNRLDENLVRFFLYKYSYQTIIKNNSTILFGYGIGDFQNELLKTYEDEEYGYGLHYKYNSHNQYLTTLLMSGTVGLFLFLWYLYLPLWFGFVKRSYKTFLAIFLLYAFLESFYNREAGILITTFFVSFFTLFDPVDIREINNK